jgi:glycosyltransferase involved in cell wall biosynthesis
VKITIKNIDTDSGGRVWFINLKKALSQYDNLKINEIIYSLPSFFSIFMIPFLKLLPSDTNSNLIQSSSYGFVFKTKNKPLVITVFHLARHPSSFKYATLFERMYRSLVCLYERLSINKADKIISISKYTQDSIKKYYGKESTMIYSGIDTNIFKPIEVKRKETNNIRLLFVGNLTKRKGVDLLPKIMDKLGNNYKLFYTSGLRTKKIFNRPNMHPLGRLTLNELVQEYNKCDLLLFPSRLEGFGYAVAEAMACGKPVIATNCSSIPELLIDEKGGFLCEMNDIEDFVEKAIILGKDQKMRLKMGKFNRRRVLNKFNLTEMAKQHMKIYLNIDST